MKKASLIIAIGALLILPLGIATSAAIPGNFTLGINAGYPYLLTELEFEYKNGPWAGGADVAWIGPGLEISAFGRYYVPLGAGFNFFAVLNPGMLIITSETPVEVRGTIKAGPGFDFRWKHLRVGIDGGLLYIFGSSDPRFYVKGGLGYIF